MSEMETPVPTFQHAKEFAQLLQIYKARQPQTVLEIGTFHGGTLYHWLQNAEPGTVVVSIDSYVTGIDNRSLYESWCPPNVSVIPIHGNSHDLRIAASAALYGPYDWVWIDAGHYYAEVRRDWDLYGPMCKPGGLVCFHDILPPTAAHPEIEVAQLWAELKPNHRTEEIIEDPEADWGGIGIVYP